jgi:cobalt-precorrin 5A hydrolase
MVVGEAVIVAGIGSRKGVTAAQVLAAIDAALAAHGLKREDLGLLATARLKRDEAGLREAADMLALDLKIINDIALQAATDQTLTRSEASMTEAGTPSVSEASALAAAGPDGRLLGPRAAVGPVTCAIAISGATHGR